MPRRRPNAGSVFKMLVIFSYYEPPDLDSAKLYEEAFNLLLQGLPRHGRQHQAHDREVDGIGTALWSKGREACIASTFLPDDLCRGPLSEAPFFFEKPCR